MLATTLEKGFGWDFANSRNFHFEDSHCFINPSVVRNQETQIKIFSSFVPIRRITDGLFLFPNSLEKELHDVYILRVRISLR